MINLIKNEFIKIFNTKSIYVMLVLLLFFVLFTNIIYKYKLDEFGNYKENIYNKVDLDKLENKLIEEKNIDQQQILRKEILTYKLYLKYGINSWQAYIIENNMSDIIDGVIENNELLLKEYDNIIQKFDKNDWKSFVKFDLEEIDSKIINISKDEYIYKVLKIDREILEYRLNNYISYENNYLNNELLNYSNYKKQMLSKNNNKYKEYVNKSNLEVSKYIVDNKINSNKVSDTRGILKNLFTEYELIIVLIVVMVSSAIISKEFMAGTIKQLLIVPYNRKKILVSKYITSLVMVLIIIFITILLEIIIGQIFFGLSSLNVPVVIYNFNKNMIMEYNIFYYLFILILSKLPMFIIIITIVFFIGIVSLNSTLSIILGMLLYMSSSIFNNLALNMKVLSYFITPNWDFSQYLFYTISENPYIKVNISIIMCVIYVIILIILSFFLFKRKEVKNI